MAAMTFHVQHVLDNPQSFSHHKSISQLWQSKWRAPCSKGVYPFEHGSAEDFEPIFDLMIRQTGDSTDILSESDKYAAFFLPVGDQLFRQAEAAEQAGSVGQAQELFLRASAVYRIARFPVTRPDSPLNWKAWEEGKAAYLRGSRYFQSPVYEVAIPFDLADVGAGDAARPIQSYLRIPQQRLPPPSSSGWPTLLFICGLDAYRTDTTEQIDKHLQDGFAVLCLEVPGTGDCPASRNDPASPERLFGTVLNWIAAGGHQEST